MFDRSGRTAQLRLLWVASFAIPAALQLSLAMIWSESGIQGSATLLFVIVLIAASLCAVASGMVINRAKRTNEAELGYLGLFFLTVSVLPLIHGILTPGVIFDDPAPAAAAAFWSVPVAVVVAVPSLLMRSELGLRIDRQWWRWVLNCMLVVVTLGGLFIAAPSFIPAPTPDALSTRAIAVAGFVGCVMLSKRHLDLAVIAQNQGPLAISFAYGLVGSSALMWFGSAPFSTGFWVAHILDITGVFLGSIGALIVYKRTDHVRPFIAPVLVVDPRSALEVGLEPAVHEFIAQLEAKDPITRDHVLRTTELAMRVGRKMALDPTMLRELGLAAMLHDIGKLLIPDAILNKPSALSDEEYRVVQRHAQYGAEIVEESEVLASIGPAIRAHHEHIDGSGYPNGLIGTQIPIIARVVSACDAYDAIANTRQYRKGASVETALGILEQHAGSQWDRRVVELLALTVRSSPPSKMPEHLDMVGRIGCDCIPKNAAA